MPTVSLTKSYATGSVLTETDLDNIRTGIQTALNTTKLDGDNLQTGGVPTAALADSAVTTAKINDLAVTTAKINTAAVTAAKLATTLVPPAGMIVAYGGTSAPTGWLLCDGTAVSRSTYSDLYAAIGVAYGYGDNSSTFNVPDLRGRFIRGVDSSQGRDPDAASRTAINTGGNTGDAVGSLQGDAYTAHTHTGAINTTVPAGSNISSGSNYSQTLNSTTTGSSGGSTETRPKNVGCWFIIKY
jgi:microcystin-dependent protein